MYADDPGGANYLAPMVEVLQKFGARVEFWLPPSLITFAKDRHFSALPFNAGFSHEELLQGADLVILGTSENRDCLAHQLVLVSKKLGIPSLGVVDMTVNAAKRFQGKTQNSLAFVPDWLAVPDELCKSIYIKLGYPADRVGVCGHPHYDVVRNKRFELMQSDQIELRQRIFPGVPSDRPIWLFLAEGIDLLNPEQSYRSSQYTLEGRGDSDFRACIVLEELLDIARNFCPQPWVVLRLHPKSNLADLSPIISELEGIQQGGDPLAAVWAADMVIGMSTMLLLETSLLQRPHFSILPRTIEASWLPTIGLNITRCAHTRQEIQSLALNPAPDFSSLDELLPLGAGDRVKKLIFEILSNGM